MKIWQLTISTLIFCAACNAATDKPNTTTPSTSVVTPLEIHDKKAAFDQIRWLQGAWEGLADGTPFCESWTFANDTLLENRSLACDTGAASEEGVGAFIRVLDGKMYYTGNPKPGETLFKWDVTELDATHIKLVCPTAPYSQTMIFERLPDDAWKATLASGNKTAVYTLHRRK